MTRSDMLYSSSELMTDAGCTRKAFRHYQNRGLIQPARNTGRRRYDEAARRRLHLVVRLRDLGVSTDDIANLLMDTSPESPASPMASHYAEELTRLARMADERISSLQDTRDRLLEAREQLLACTHCHRDMSGCEHCADLGFLHPVSATLMAS